MKSPRIGSGGSSPEGRALRQCQGLIPGMVNVSLVPSRFLCFWIKFRSRSWALLSLVPVYCGLGLECPGYSWVTLFRCPGGGGLRSPPRRFGP